MMRLLSLSFFPQFSKGNFAMLRWYRICNVEDLGLIPGLGRSSGEGNVNPLQYSWLENSMRRRSLVGYSPWGHKESDCSLVGYSPWGHKESDMTEQLTQGQVP